MENSIRRLSDELDLMDRSFGIPVEKRVWFCVDKYAVVPSCESVICKTFPEMVEAVAQTLK